MDGAHDMGGVKGFGPVKPEPNEPVFHAPWEGRVMAMSRAMGANGGLNIDMQRFARELLPSNFDRFEQLAVLAAKRTPILEKVGVRQLINGPIPYSADSDFIMGKAAELASRI